MCSHGFFHDVAHIAIILHIVHSRALKLTMSIMQIWRYALDIYIDITFFGEGCGNALDDIDL
jgi:hypothetical protein